MFKKKFFYSLCVALVFCVLLQPINVAALGSSFDDMVGGKVSGTDYKIESFEVDSDVAVIAIHGGDIEPFTSRIAALIAGGSISTSGNSYIINEEVAKFNYYSFKGLMVQTPSSPAINFDNFFLSAVEFDEPTALEMVSKSAVTLSVIGIEDEKYDAGKVIYIGGLDTVRKPKLVEALKPLGDLYGFKALEAPLNANTLDLKDINGDNPNNICNKNQNLKGLQMAISLDLRNELTNSENKKELNDLVAAVQGVLSYKDTPSDNGSGSGGGGKKGGISTVVVTPPAIQFTDIKGHWAEAKILKAAQDGYLEGYPDGTFKPDNNIKRAEFVVALVKALKLDVKAGKGFTDTETHWAKDYIATAALNGIISSDTELFQPEEYITRQVIAQMLANAKKVGVVTEGKKFSDYGTISSGAQNAVNWVSFNNIMVGYPDNTFRPAALATRAEASTILINYTNIQTTN